MDVLKKNSRYSLQMFLSLQHINNFLTLVPFYICHHNLQMHLLFLPSDHKLRKICPSTQITLFEPMECVSNHLIHLSTESPLQLCRQIDIQPLIGNSLLPKTIQLDHSSLHCLNLPPSDCQPLILVGYFEEKSNPTSIQC